MDAAAVLDGLKEQFDGEVKVCQDFTTYTLCLI